MNKPLVAWLILFVLLTTSALAQNPGKELCDTALHGDLAKVKALVESGVAVDSANRWGTTALAFAVSKGHHEVASYLLERGADPSTQETFFGVTVLDHALGAMGELDLEMAKLILAAGAEDRASALWQAFSKENLELAEAAVASGPILVSELEALRSQFPALEGKLAETLSQAQTKPDPPPPEYSEEDLRAFTGPFDGGEHTAEMRLVEERLGLSLDGAQVGSLLPRAERSFQSDDGKVRVDFFGRAGMVEGFSLEQEGQDRIRLRAVDIVEVSPSVRVAQAPMEEVLIEPTLNWPGFRGKNRSGIGDGIATPVDWDLESGKGVLWKAALDGLGNSSPIVWQDKVFVTTAVAAGKQEALKTGLTGSGTEVEEASEHRWLVLAFDKRTGKKVWETEVGRSIPLTRRHFKATQANSTPVTDGRHVVVVFPTAGLACLGMDGMVHWRQELGGLNAGGFNDPTLQWGFASSPILLEDRVILQVDIHDGPYIAAWNLEDGKLLWRKERPDVAPSWATPAVWDTDQGREIVTNASTIYSYDPETGEELWSVGPNSVQVVASPVIGDEVAFLSSGYPPIKPIYAIRAGIRGSHQIEAGTSQPELAWSQGRGGAYMPTPLLYRGLYYVIHHNSRLVAYDAETGTPVYKARFSEPGTATGSPVVVNGKIYQGTEEGRMFVFEAGPEYRELAKHEFGEPLMATPAVSEGILFVRTPGHLIALAEPTETTSQVTESRAGRSQP